MKFEINFIFLIKLFCCMTEKSREKLKYLENKISFWRRIESIFHHFYRTSSCQILYQTWECLFKFNLNSDEEIITGTKTLNMNGPCSISKKFLKNIEEALQYTTRFSNKSDIHKMEIFWYLENRKKKLYL